MKTKILQAIMATVSLMILASCSVSNISTQSTTDIQATAAVVTQVTDEPKSSAAPTKVEIYPAAIDIITGRSITLTAVADGDQAIDWSSSVPLVASVSSDGTIGAISAGETLITATAGGSSDVCRVTVTDGGSTVAYPEDPGPMNQDGKHDSSDNADGNYPLFMPDDQNSIHKADFEAPEYSWQFLIDDEFDTKLTVPMTDMAYMIHCRVILDAHKAGGDSPMGEYEGTMKMEIAIDEESFLAAAQSMDIPATDFSSAISVRTVPVNFTVVTYQRDEIIAAKYACAPSGTTPLIPLVRIPAMAISSTETSTSGESQVEIDGGYGSAALTDLTGEIPLVIEVRSDGEATLYLPQMLSMCDRDSFDGTLVRMRLLDLP